MTRLLLLALLVLGHAGWVAGGGLEDFGNNTFAGRVSANGTVVVGGYIGRR